MIMLSVALCTYNGERYIQQQLESILWQTLPVDEIVVCDDGSTDQTLSLLHSVADGSTVSIRVYRNDTHMGVCANFQKAVDLCQGEIIFLCDQDDVWFPEKTSSIVNFFRQHPDKSVIFTNADLIDETGEPLPPPSNELWDYFFHDFSKQQFDSHLEFECFLMDNHATGATMAARKCFLQQNPFLPLCNNSILHDYAIAFTAVMKRQIGYLDTKTLQYRIHDRQHSGIPFGTNERLYSSPFDAIFAGREALAMISDSHYKGRARFLDFRRATKYRISGPIAVMLQWRKYKTFYSSSASRIMRHDILTSLSHTRSRLRRLISKW